MGGQEKFPEEHERQEERIKRPVPDWPNPMPGGNRWEDMPTKVDRGEEEWPPKWPTPPKTSSGE